MCHTDMRRDRSLSCNASCCIAFHVTALAIYGIVGAVREAVIADVRKFTNGAEQSDDITMLCVRYPGNER